ncbi:SHOCT domain-containing protein [Demequina mangrovi]|uniref:Short C-terminal domain-containing protein n=1 Tax=Demequina mangrovi TaxID=1043493 RepID=A0A1H6UAC7_9MICO|nr:SHOCT domain-containing protein [Demequina mangrovi]SEI89281.1 Short C-terminal domain-containing protein [Demequina mangrovi]
MSETELSRDERRWQREREKHDEYERRMRDRARERALDAARHEARRAARSTGPVDFDDIATALEALPEAHREFRRHARGLVVTVDGEPAFLWAGPAGIEVAPALDSPGTLLPWDQITTLTIDGAEVIQERVTAGRFVALGWAAFAFPHREGSAYALIERRGGEPLLCEAPLTTTGDLRALVLPHRTRAESAGGRPDMLAVEALERLAALHASGALTDAEFTAAKAKVLGG